MKQSSNIRTLIISHNPMNFSENNGRTIRNLFFSMECENVAQLFFHEGIVDADFCTDYYRITDMDIKDSILKFKSAGKILTKDDYSSTSEVNNATYEKYSSKKSGVKLLRNLAWNIDTWKSKQLKNWLKKVNPNVVFFFASDTYFVQRIAKWVCKFLNVPMVIYWQDDYYLKLKNRKGLLEKINNYFYKKITKYNISYSKNICITQSMADEYKKEFGCEFETILNCSFLEPFEPKTNIDRIQMSFLGNISLGRFNSIKKIGKIIYENNLPIDFNVYSGEFRENILENIRDGVGYKFLGKVEYDEVKQIMDRSDILVHVEDFEQENIEYCRYSLSTKIADSLASNRCLLVFGPFEDASINYFKKKDGALVASDENELKDLLKTICNNKGIINETASKGYELYLKNHSVQKNTEKLRQILQSEITSKSN